MTPTLVLASTSRYRQALLRRLDIPFDVVDPALDETPWQNAGLSPQAMCEALALAKAQAGADMYRPTNPSTSWILGGDQTAECGGTLLHKPGTRARAIEQLQRLQGREHRLWTSIVLWSPSTQTALSHTDVTRLWMRPLTAHQITRYLDADEPYDCAGSYKIEARGVALFTRIASDDPSAIEGLPLMALTTLLGQAGWELP